LCNDGVEVAEGEIEEAVTVEGEDKERDEEASAEVDEITGVLDVVVSGLGNEGADDGWDDAQAGVEKDAHDAEASAFEVGGEGSREERVGVLLENGEGEADDEDGDDGRDGGVDVHEEEADAAGERGGELDVEAMADVVCDCAGDRREEEGPVEERGHVSRGREAQVAFEVEEVRYEIDRRVQNGDDEEDEHVLQPEQGCRALEDTARPAPHGRRRRRCRRVDVVVYVKAWLFEVVVPLS